MYIPVNIPHTHKKWTNTPPTHTHTTHTHTYTTHTHTHTQDKKTWEKFSDDADKQEQELHLLNQQDEIDLNQIDTIAQTYPNADIDTYQAKKALTRQVSITDSIYDESYMFGGAYYLPSSATTPSPGLTSPSKIHDDHGRRLSAILEESQNLDPEMHNIHAHVGHRRTSIVEEQTTEFNSRSATRGAKGQQSSVKSSITGQSTLV